MNCLDTYALVEIRANNPKYAKITNEDFIIADLTLAEFYWVLLREENPETAYVWYLKFKPFVVETNMELYIKAMDYKYKHKKQKLSFYDCFGYLLAREKNCKFVTGDKQFKKKKNVLFITSPQAA